MDRDDAPICIDSLAGLVPQMQYGRAPSGMLSDETVITC
jgi:hypothetical protein